MSRVDLERSLAELEAIVADPGLGIYGPDSPGWQLNGDVFLFAGSGRAILLQLAHPCVAAAIDHHSTTRSDVRGRFQRTFDAIFAMTFGDLDHALSAARRVHAVHTRITGELTDDAGAWRRGDLYHANDADALMWVHATLLDTTVAVRAAIGHPVPPATVNRYYADSMRFARLFGIPGAVLPADWPAFQRYVADMVGSEKLAVSSAAREMAEFVFAPPAPALAPLMVWMRVLTAGLLPERLREPFGLAFGPAERAAFRASMTVLGAARRVVPRPMRLVPGYLHALARVGAGSRSPLGRLGDHLAMRGLSLWNALIERPLASASR